MRVLWLSVTIFVLLISPYSIAAFGQDELSDGRSLGIGAQVGLPVIGISVRLWIEDFYGLEVDYFPLFTVQLTTIRGLVKIANKPVADLYIAGGGAFAFAGSSFSFNTHIAMGIEYSFAHEVALHAEVGIATYGSTSAFLFGGGIYFYF